MKNLRIDFDFKSQNGCRLFYKVIVPTKLVKEISVPFKKKTKKQQNNRLSGEFTTADGKRVFFMESASIFRIGNKEYLKVTKPRPGHADLPGALKYRFDDIRNVSERASARETAARVAAGVIADKILSPLGVEVLSYTLELGGIRAKHFGRSCRHS